MERNKTFIGETVLQNKTQKVNGDYVQIDGEKFYKISNYDNMQPFFMTVVSASNHWQFISSKGGLTAGRQDFASSLFPYENDDKIHDVADTTGSKTIVFVKRDEKKFLWEPFINDHKKLYNLQRNIYKNIAGNKLIFEEVNKDLNITFQYSWCNSDKYGFVKTSKITNQNSENVQVNILDGLQNILPASVSFELYKASSTLVDGYKKGELLDDSGLAIYSLSAIPVDKAEPSESLKSSIAWSVGLNKPSILLSSQQLESFVASQEIEQEIDVRAQRCAYFVNSQIELAENQSKEWSIVIDIDKDISDIVALQDEISSANINNELKADIEEGTVNLTKIVASADGLQHTADELSTSRHFANTMFNVMRGGIFENNYDVEKKDFIAFFENANKLVVKENAEFLNSLPDTFQYSELLKKASATGNSDLERICHEYMPLSFSRRHGDPSRPWNKFSIKTKNEDGSKNLFYEGNWRDIFQNWEALSLSFPGYIESMVSKFINASTADGYNPYRITRDGIDWEVIDPNEPWSYIGYWGDHQIVYLLRLLEASNRFHPEKLQSFLSKEMFSYSNVPYRIKPYSEILKNSQDTITFDEDVQRLTEEKVAKIGSDGKLLLKSDDTSYLVNLTEKLLVTVLTKFSNFVPEGGIWMNTQRPEWNDANNALVGNGISMVTLCYMRPYQEFLVKLLSQLEESSVTISEEVAKFLKDISTVFAENLSLLNGSINGEDRKMLVDSLGNAGSVYREKIYKDFSGSKEELSIKEIIQFCELSLKYIDHTIKANKKEDNLYHSYNLMDFQNGDSLEVKNLYEMLEGQVAVLSCGALNTKESLDILEAMRSSKLYRENQQSYMLYPNRQLPLFVDRNNISSEDFKSSELLRKLVENGNSEIVVRDIKGDYHFNSAFRNSAFLKIALENLKSSAYKELVEKDAALILDIYEKVFNHAAFTGRSGTFYKYEGLGSIYWHMVSKLLLAVEDIHISAAENNESKDVLSKLSENYYAIREGIGVNKSPENYGAFPTDPYSHSPGHSGVQQPGLTGQVKEDVISRFGEFGLKVKDGTIGFGPELLKISEFLSESAVFKYYNIYGEEKSLNLEKNTLAFTFCQVAVVYRLADANKLKVVYSDNSSEEFGSMEINSEISSEIFNRSGKIEQIEVFVKK